MFLHLLNFSITASSCKKKYLKTWNPTWAWFCHQRFMTSLLGKRTINSFLLISCFKTQFLLLHYVVTQDVERMKEKAKINSNFFDHAQPNNSPCIRCFLNFVIKQIYLYCAKRNGYLIVLRVALCASTWVQSKTLNEVAIKLFMKNVCSWREYVHTLNSFYWAHKIRKYWNTQYACEL